jgi:ATP-dependent Clp protease ATP-binding subunit ClpB
MLESSNIELQVSDGAIDWLTEKGYDPHSGARPVKRLIQREIVNELSKELIAGRISRDSVVKISVKDRKLMLK